MPEECLKKSFPIPKGLPFLTLGQRGDLRRRSLVCSLLSALLNGRDRFDERTKHCRSSSEEKVACRNGAEEARDHAT